ncbi:hypothetical protein [Sphingobium yanoikuyae]|uniref:hypothetical protein n=1 Tax=Sphingobium yanoikuyae TaxID=13690 RepID=UPI003F021B09
MLGNRFALSMTFILFATMVCGLAWAIGNEVVGYIVAAGLFSGLGILEQLGVITAFRGFLRFALLIVLPSAAFPLADLGYLPFPEVALWIAAFTMLAALPIFWWQIAKRGQSETSFGCPLMGI